MIVSPAVKIKKLHLIVNPRAGKRNPDVLPAVEAGLKEAGIEFTTFITQKSRDARRQANEAVQNGVDAVAVCGGDGTVVEAAAGLAGTDVPLLIFPTGSANVMSNEMGLPKDPREMGAMIALNTFEARAVDAAQSSKGFFLVRASLGLAADMVKDTNRKTKNRWGVLAYFLSAFSAVKRVQLAEYCVKVDGVEYCTRGVTCIVTNAGNMGFSKVSLDNNVMVDDGLLDVLILKKANLHLVPHALKTLLLRKRPEDWSLVAHWQGREITATSKPMQMLEVDGEPLEPGPLEAKVLPGAVRLLVPVAAS